MPGGALPISFARDRNRGLRRTLRQAPLLARREIPGAWEMPARAKVPVGRPLSPHLQIFRPIITMVMSILHRDGRLSVPLKGNNWKGPFHLPRMQLVCWKLLEEMKANAQ
jgi:hypothetical protein